jgi:hypothetical protein
MAQKCNRPLKDQQHRSSCQKECCPVRLPSWLCLCTTTITLFSLYITHIICINKQRLGKRLQENSSLIRFGYFMSRMFSTSLAESVHHRSSFQCRFLSWRGHSSDTLLIPLTYNSTHPRYRLAFHLETVSREAFILISIYLPKSLFYSCLYFPS